MKQNCDQKLISKSLNLELITTFQVPSISRATKAKHCNVIPDKRKSDYHKLLYTYQRQIRRSYCIW